MRYLILILALAICCVCGDGSSVQAQALQAIVGAQPLAGVLPPFSTSVTASEDFSSGSLDSSKWTPFFGAATGQIAGGVSEPATVGVRDAQYYSGKIWPNDQTSEVTLAAPLGPGTNTVDLWVRVQSGAYSGYVASLSQAGVISIYKCVAGAFTQLSSAVDLTVVPGDVFSFNVSGSVLTVYQNNNPMFRYGDATFTGGYPGFSQYTNTAVSDSQVSLWRGRDAVQQDGVWQKQGIVIPALAGDLQYGTVNATMLYEGSAQLLSGTVYKMWLGSGAGNIYYAESSDGVAWTRSGSPVITSQAFPFIIKNGATYHLYSQTLGGAGNGNFAHYTSSDGISWSLQSSNVFGLGAGGQWDDTVIWYFQPVAISGGTWYAVYCAGNNATSYQLSLGLATSSDGITWTRYGSNPVLVGPNSGSVVNGGALTKVGSTYYMWMYGNQPGQGGAVPNLDPGSGVRYQTTDFITWTNPVHSVHMSEPFEGYNFKTGQAFPNGIFTVGGRTFMYVQSSPSDNTPTMGYQLSLAVAPVPIDVLVQHPEDAMPQTASDNFTSGTGDLSANWTTPSGLTKLQIVSGPYVESTTTSAWNGMRYSGASFNNDQWSEITVHAASSTGVTSPAVRMQSNGNCYFMQFLGDWSASNQILYKRVGGVDTALMATGMTVSAGDKLRLSVVGNILTVYQNGFQILRVEDFSHAVPSGGVPGMLIYATTLVDEQIGGWSGGNAGVLPY